ncbi:MAG: PEPxxWA-CTERM sorting domain-containing protein [Pseudomonadota bacterium]
MARTTSGILAAVTLLFGAGEALAGDYQVDLSPYVNQGFANGGWFINGGAFQADIVGTTYGNQGTSTALNVASVDGGAKGTLNYWYGLDNGSGRNLFEGVINSITIPITVTGVRQVHTLADNTFGAAGANEFSITFHGAGGDFTRYYVGGVTTRDYNTANCASTGCTSTPGADTWYVAGAAVLEQVVWDIPDGFGLTGITFTQQHAVNGAILAGVTLSVPEPSTWALMIGGFGLAGASLRRRQVVLARAG